MSASFFFEGPDWGDFKMHMDQNKTFASLDSAVMQQFWRNRSKTQTSHMSTQLKELLKYLHEGQRSSHISIGEMRSR